jgi:hypothetical protein
LPGDGIAFDNDLSNYGDLIIQYNYSHDNEGGFFMDCESNSIPVLPSGARTILRYNISVNDGNIMNPRYSTYEDSSLPSPYTDDITCRTMVTSKGNDIVYNNTFCDLSNQIRIENWESSINNDFKNNIFYSADICLVGPNKMTFDNNCYYGGMQNSVNIPSDAHHLYSNPKFINIDGGTSGFRLQPNSPCINAGIKIENNGGRDFWGAGLYNYKPEIGAYEVPNIVPILNLLLND